MANFGRWKVNSALHDLDVTRRVIQDAESRALRTNASKLLRGNNRQYAQALHRQADELCQRGEYESALVLYHRAATMCPHDSNHSAAARRTAATISSWSNPQKSSARLSANTGDDMIVRVTSCPDSTVLKARNSSKSYDPSIISDILRYLDVRKRTSLETLPALDSLTMQLTRSQTILKHINNRADAILRNLKANFNAGKMRTSLRLAEDLLTLSSDRLGDPRRHRIPAYHYLSLIHTALGRHDRASNSAATLVCLSKSTNDVVILSQALVTLGKVHLSFGYLEAAARAWETMSVHVDHPVPRAWLHHEIGRCHLETGKYVKALRKAVQCRECADEAKSKKWVFYARLLRAQCLAMLGRFAEAFEELRVTAKISEDEGDTPTLSYIRDLIEQLNRARREVTFGEDRCLKGALRRLSPREELGRSKGNEAITTSRRRTACSREGPLTLSLCSNHLEDNMFDRYEIDEELSSVNSSVSLKSKRTNLTYVIDSCTDFSNRDKLDGMKINDEEMVESCESHMTFQTCYIERFNDEEKTPVLFQEPIKPRSSNIETSVERVGYDTFRISRSCESERQCSFDTVIDRTRCDDTIRASRGYSLLPEAPKQNEKFFVREDFTS